MVLRPEWGRDGRRHLAWEAWDYAAAPPGTVKQLGGREHPAVKV